MTPSRSCRTSRKTPSAPPLLSGDRTRTSGVGSLVMTRIGKIAPTKKQKNRIFTANIRRQIAAAQRKKRRRIPAHHFAREMSRDHVSRKSRKTGQSASRNPSKSISPDTSNLKKCRKSEIRFVPVHFRYFSRTKKMHSCTHFRGSTSSHELFIVNLIPYVLVRMYDFSERISGALRSDPPKTNFQPLFRTGPMR